MVRILDGQVILENKVVDLPRLEIRPKVRGEDLNRHYDCFVEHLGEVREHFKNERVFEQVVADVTGEKKPKLIPRELRYPFLLALRTSPLADILNPSKRRLNDKYFTGGHCLVCIPIKSEGAADGEKEKSLNENLDEDIKERFRQHPGYERIIEVPNSRTPPETKSTLFHEATHYLVARYQTETRGNFVDAFVKKDLSALERYRVERLVDEHVVEILTDKLLAHDEDALFESRWPAYCLFNNVSGGFPIASSGIAIGLLLAFSIINPYLLPLTLVPGRIRDFALERGKASRRDEVLRSAEHLDFKF